MQGIRRKHEEDQKETQRKPCFSTPGLRKTNFQHQGWPGIKKTFDRTKVFHECDFVSFRLGYRIEFFVVIQGWDLIDDVKLRPCKKFICHYQADFL